MRELCEVLLQGMEHRRISILSWPLHCHLYMYADRASDIACCGCKCVVFTHTRTHARTHTLCRPTLRRLCWGLGGGFMVQALLTFRCSTLSIVHQSLSLAAATLVAAGAMAGARTAPTPTRTLWARLTAPACLMQLSLRTALRPVQNPATTPPASH